MKDDSVRTLVRHLVLVGAAIVLGFIIHDYRYGPFSVAVIVLGRPVLSTSIVVWAMASSEKKQLLHEIWWGLAALVAANLAALLRLAYETGPTLMTDRLSTGILIVSFVAQVVVFALILTITALILRRRHRGRAAG